jgi:hypothetical protein
MPNIANPPGANQVVKPNVGASSGAGTPGGDPSGSSTLVMIFRIVRWTVYGCALIVLILLLHKTAPPPVQTTPEAAARVEQKFQDVRQAVAQGQPATLRMDETELNSYLASHLDIAGVRTLGSTANTASNATPGGAAPGGTPSSEQPSPEDVEQMRSNVKDVKVQLIDDRVRAYVVFDVQGKEMTLELEGRLGADNGFLRFEPVSGRIGSLPIPQSTLEAAVRRMMESPENRDKLRLPSDISGLKIENGEVVATYQ